jgi:AraC-like DNA-binding protein
LGTDEASANLLVQHGVRGAHFADPDCRISHRLAMDLLEMKIEATGDPTVGLRAASVIEPGDIDVCEYACRSCANLGEAIGATARYVALMNEAAVITVIEDGENVIVEYRAIDDVFEPPAAIDFVLATMVIVDRRTTGADDSDCEAWFRRERPRDVQAYERLFGPRRVRFGMKRDALVVPRGRLLVPMLQADPRSARAFRLRAEQSLSQLKERAGTAGRVRELVADHLASGKVTMSWAAQQLEVSVPTLRRYLQTDGATFSEILDARRRQVAEQALGEGRTSISELAFILGFSNVAAFYRAFKRYTGQSPAEYRAQVRRPR